MPSCRADKDEASFKDTVLEINKKFWQVALPAIAAQFSVMFGLSISLFYVAYLRDPEKTAAVGLGVSVLMMLCEGPVIGMNTAISILVSIAFGNKDFKQCEEILQTGRVICACTFFCTIILL